MVVSPRCLERGPSSTPSHHQCEGRPPALQASRAQRATHSAVASAACLEQTAARYPIYDLSLLPGEPVAQRADAGDVDLDDITRFQVRRGAVRAHPDYVARPQREI